MAGAGWLYLQGGQHHKLYKRKASLTKFNLEWFAQRGLQTILWLEGLSGQEANVSDSPGYQPATLR